MLVECTAFTRFRREIVFGLVRLSVVTVLGLIVFWVGGVILGLVMKVLLIVRILVAAVIIQKRCGGKSRTNGIFNTFEK